MSNPALIFAALCAKAADVAVADKISESSTRTAVKRNAPASKFSSGAVAAVCAKSREFRIADDASVKSGCGNEALTPTSTYRKSYSQGGHEVVAESSSPYRKYSQGVHEVVDTFAEYQNENSRHSRISTTRSTRDRDYNRPEDARDYYVDSRYLNDVSGRRDKVGTSRHSRFSNVRSMNSRDDPNAVNGLRLGDSNRDSRRSLMDSSCHSQTDASVEMDAHDFLAMARQMVIAPSGGASVAEECAPAPVSTIFSRQRSCDMSCASSISDPDCRPESVEDLVSSLDSDNLIEALCKKAQTDSGLARKLAMAAEQLSSPQQGNDGEGDEEAVDVVIATLIAKLSAMKGAISDTTSRVSVQSVNKASHSREKSPQRSIASGVGGKRSSRRKQGRKVSKGQRLTRQSDAESESNYRSGDDSPKTANNPVLNGPSLVNTLSNNDVPSDEALAKVGWYKTLDTGSGKYYYYTGDRGNVSWDNPLLSMRAPNSGGGASLAFPERASFPLKDCNDSFAQDFFGADAIDDADADDCFQVVYSRKESVRNVAAR